MDMDELACEVIHRAQSSSKWKPLNPKFPSTHNLRIVAVARRSGHSPGQLEDFPSGLLCGLSDSTSAKTLTLPLPVNNKDQQESHEE